MLALKRTRSSVSRKYRLIFKSKISQYAPFFSLPWRKTVSQLCREFVITRLLAHRQNKTKTIGKFKLATYQSIRFKDRAIHIIVKFLFQWRQHSETRYITLAFSTT